MDGKEVLFVKCPQEKNKKQTKFVSQSCQRKKFVGIKCQQIMSTEFFVDMVC